MNKKISFSELIVDCLDSCYRVKVTSLVLIPVGADTSALIYKALDREGQTYFVKVKQGCFNDVNIEILELLEMAGIQQLIHPVKTIEGKLTQQLNDLTIVVYPFVRGQNGFKHSLTDKQWIALGRSLRQVHEIKTPLSLKTCMRHECFSSKWRNLVKSLYSDNQAIFTTDEVALSLWELIQEKKSMIQQLVDRSEQLSQVVHNQPFKFVICHSDIHAGNVLISDKDTFFIVDWDAPILAPKERDLMFIGGGVGNVWNKPHEEELFYQGYGEVDVNWVLLTYYRYERIVEDIAEYCQELLLKPTEGKDRLKMYEEFLSMFEQHGVIDIAFETDQRLTR